MTDKKLQVTGEGVTASLWLERAEKHNSILPTPGSPMAAAVAEEMEEYAEQKVAAFARLSALRAKQPGGDVVEGWQPIETAPKDRTEFLSAGGTQGRAGQTYPTKWLSPGPYSTENGKNTPGERRFQYPDGFYWAGYDGFVGPVDPTHWMPLPAAPTLAKADSAS